MAEQPETRLAKRMVAAVKKAHPDVWVLKVHGHREQRAGVPDLLLCVNGYFLGLEVKCPQPGETVQHARDRATALQKIEIGRIRGAGGRADVVTKVEEVLAWVELLATKP